MQDYGGLYLTPGMGTEFFTQEQQIWFGREEQQLVLGGVFDSTLVDSGNTSYTNILRPGLALGRITSSGKLAMWNPYALDGTNRLVGFFLGQQQMNLFGVATERFVGGVLVKGNVYASRLLIPGQTTYGISGKTYEFLLREQMLNRFLVDDDMGLTNWKEYAIASDQTALTVTTAMHRTIFITDELLAADCTLTLPAPVPGLEFGFVHPSTTATTELILDAPATGEFWVAGAAANTVTIAGDNTTGLRKIRVVKTKSTPVYSYVLDGVAA